MIEKTQFLAFGENISRSGCMLIADIDGNGMFVNVREIADNIN